MENIEQCQALPIPELAALRQCLVALDVTPAVRHRIEQVLHESEAQLQQRLQQAARQAQHSTRLGDMATHIVHDIRNPLNAIFLHADVIEEEMRQPTVDSRVQIRESISDIRTEVMRLYSLMQDYLALARLAALERTTEELGAVLNECALEIQAQAETRGITLHLQGLTRLGHVLLHKGTLRHAVLNLMQHALDAMPEGGTLTLRGRRATSQVTVEVRDTGSGIPEEHLPFLFDPFTTANTEGTSIGLYVTREIIAAHHGTIDVQCVSGTGTAFTITLPVTAEATPPR